MPFLFFQISNLEICDSSYLGGVNRKQYQRESIGYPTTSSAQQAGSYASDNFPQSSRKYANSSHISNPNLYKSIESSEQHKNAELQSKNTNGETLKYSTNKCKANMGHNQYNNEPLEITSSYLRFPGKPTFHRQKSCDSPNSAKPPDHALEERRRLESGTINNQELHSLISSSSLHDLSHIQQQMKFPITSTNPCPMRSCGGENISNNSRHAGANFSQNDRFSASTSPSSIIHYATLGRKPILKSTIRNPLSIKTGVGDFLSSKHQESAV